ncbi:cystatin-like [Pristis pectinata]|uniref:cystatin-like n=1 Tax=Pristis pectinata TaxID=685728 RepID=UPI00223DDC39|nr:cystatin-like [Pristis pectinata]
MAVGPVLWALLVAGAAAVAMPGGLFPVSVRDPGVLNATRVAEEAFNRLSNELHYSAVAEVVSAQTQVVEGLLYHIRVVLRSTTCKKSRSLRNGFQNCRFLNDPRYAKKRICDFKVWSRPWRKLIQVTSQNCSVVTE